jgi:hypothetical protein
MQFTALKNSLKKFFQSSDFFALVMLAGVFFLACFLHFRSFGVYGDDWSAGTYLYHNSLGAALREWWAMGSGEIANFRPLAIILPIMWYFVFQFAGLAGVALVIYILYLSLGWLLYKLLKRSLSPLVALVASLLFLVYPTNNFYLWQVTSTYPLSLIFLFCGVNFFYRKNYWLVFCFLLLSLLVNEGVFFLFFIALLPTQKLANLKELVAPFSRWLAVTLPAVVLYGILRVVLEAKGIISGGRAVEVLGHFQLVAYAGQFVKSYLVVLVSSWGFVGWKLLYFARPADFLIGSAVAAISVPVFWRMAKFNNPAGAGKIPVWYIMVMGLALIIAGRYYGFYYVPSINVLNLDSRYYFAASLGGAVFFAGVLEYLIRRFSFKRGMVVILLVLALGFGTLAAFKSSVQRDYTVSWSQAKAVWRSLLSSVPSLQPGQVIILNTPPVVLGELVGLNQGLGDLHLLIPRIYDSAATGYVNSSITAMTFPKNLVCITTPLEHFCSSKDNVLFFDISGTRVVPEKNYYFSPGVVQHIPLPLKAVLEK